MLSEKKPELSFQRKDGSLWKNNRGRALIIHTLKWIGNIAIAKEAAKPRFLRNTI
nr:hypothetical protein [Paenibacillus abyssi]